MPTSWNVTPHRDEHGYPATMTGDDGMRVLDLDMELGEHAAGIMQEHGRAWLKGRLMYYGEKSDGGVCSPGAGRVDRAAAEGIWRTRADDV